jgi:hypothetical protein
MRQKGRDLESQQGKQNIIKERKDYRGLADSRP